MSQWTEIRQMHHVDGVPKREIARRLGLDIKTVRRAIERAEPPTGRKSPARGRKLDPARSRIEELLKSHPNITAKRIGRVLEAETGGLRPRTIRKYVAEVRREVHPPECFVHRTHDMGATAEFDFGEGYAKIAGKLRKVKFLVASLNASNLYFAKAYPAERTEALLDGMLSAFIYFGGLTERAVLDNTSLAVKKVLPGRAREQTHMFEAFCGALPIKVDFCAPAKGNEKGIVEGGVKYVRANGLTPTPEVESFDELNKLIMEELERDLDTRKLKDGRTIREAWEEEQGFLRPLPRHLPATCRVSAGKADKYAHVRFDGSTYSIPSIHVRREVVISAYHDRVVLAVAGKIVAEHPRAYRKGTLRLDPMHILGVLEAKHRAIAESTAIRQWTLPEVFAQLRTSLEGRTKKPDREWIQVLRLTQVYPQDKVESATQIALDCHSPRLSTIEMILRQGEGWSFIPAPLDLSEHECPELVVGTPDLAAWDALWAVQS